jgi:hypothetical protein
MGKELWKPGNMLYPLPAVMVSLADQEGHPNIITLAWVEQYVPIRPWYRSPCVRSDIPIRF